MDVNFILLHMPVCGVCSQPGECMEHFTDTKQKRKWASWKTRLRYTRVVNEENGCRFKGQRKETWIYMQPTLLLVVMERMLES